MVVVALLATLGSSAGVPVWLTLPVAVALTLGVTQLLAAGMVAPLRSMTEVAQQMARGDYSGRVHTPPPTRSAGWPRSSTRWPATWPWSTPSAAT